MKKVYIAEIMYANAPELGSILLRVVAERKSEAEYKVGKFIEDNLQGQRYYRLSLLEQIKEI